MAIDLKRYLDVKELKRIINKFPKEFIIGFVVVIVVVGLFVRSTIPPLNPTANAVLSSGASAIELNVINVNPVIARQFNLPVVSGVLINDIPEGTVRKILGLRRSDVILKYNNINIQSARHLSYLMSQSRPADTVSFTAFRKGKEFTTSIKVPQSASMVDAYNVTAVNITMILVVLILTFSALFFNIINRTVCIVLGAVLTLVVGSTFGFYDQSKAFDSVRISPILIFIGMSVFSIFLEKLKFFDYAAKRLIVKMQGDSIKVVFALCFMTYIFSLFVNNLSTIMVMIPITLYITRGLNINPVPVVISEIIASNIGGASTMMGDFPNMLISSNTGLMLWDFLVFMAPICFILLMSLFWYMRRFEFMDRKRSSTSANKAFLQKLKKEISGMEIDWPSAKRVLTALACVIAGFIVLPVFRIQPATVALAGGFGILAIENKQARDVLKRINFTDVIFFIALFIIVGGALHSGLLKVISDSITSLSGGNKVFYLLLLMWVAAFVTAFLNAGPATAFFIPIVMSAHLAAFGDIIWWALSLGVLAGSSATVTGATAGIVTQTLLEEDNSVVLNGSGKSLITFGNFSKRGVPLAVMFLVISNIYIMFLCSIQR